MSTADLNTLQWFVARELLSREEKKGTLLEILLPEGSDFDIEGELDILRERAITEDHCDE